ncbi:MAG: hypothetical protein JWM95_1096 [Gemmatimonadetes bacterium]|nr:hypothetical protein [Gemmatimonadota bacterium]
MRLRSPHVRLALLFVFGLACTERVTGPVRPAPLAPAAPVVARIACVATPREHTVRCARPDTTTPRSALAAALFQVDRPLEDLIVGGQNVFVTLTASHVSYAGDVFAFDVAVTNLLPQALGTTDGTTLDPTGVRVFFEAPPVTITGSGTIDYADPVGGASMVDGTGTFTASNQAYYQYATLLAPNQTSAARTWRLHVPAPVTSFEFYLYVSAAVRYPTGWAEVAPPSVTLPAAATQPLTATVRDEVGRIQAGAPVTWGTSNAAVATVDAAGVVTAVADGVATLTATSTTRTGTTVITVSTAAGATTTITGPPTPLTVGSAATITVQARNGAGANMTTGGDVVALTVSAGAVGPVTDAGDGTYTATVTSTQATTISITGTIRGATIGHPGSATFTAGAPAALGKSAGDAQSATVNTTVATAPGVTITDANGNPVPGRSVSFVAASGGGSVVGGSATTNASGVATVGSWKLGTAAGANTLTAASAGVPTVTFTATGTAAAPATVAKHAGDAQSAVVNTTVATAPRVLVTDPYGNPVPGTSVTFTPASGGGSVTLGTTSTDASGLASVGSWTLGTAAGATTLVATAGVVTATFTATATPDVPANIAKTAGDLQNGTVGGVVAIAPAVHVTDQYGNVVPGVTVTFAIAGGGGSRTTPSPTTDAAGNAAVGSWTLGGTAPGPNQLTATAAGGSTPSTTFIAYVPPSVLSDSSQAMGNTALGSSIGPNVLANDAGLNGTALTITNPGTPLTTARGGTLTVAADGTFTYAPPAGNVARDSVLYTVGDGHRSATGYLKVRFVGKVWYVENSGSNGDGRDVSPFSSVANAEAVAGVNDTILVRTGSGVTTGGTLKNGQILRGQGHSAAFTTLLNGQTVSLLATGTRPQVGGLTLGSGNSLRGFRVVTAAGAGIVGSSIGTLSLGDLAVGATGGAALDLATGTVTGPGGTGAAVLDSVRSTNSPATGITLSGVSGTLTVTSGAASLIMNPTGAAVSITGGSPVLTFPGTLSKTNGSGAGIVLTSSGASATFSGTSVVLNTGTSAGITMSSVTGTVSFADGVSITTTSGPGITATTGGTLAIAGTHNTITSSAGVALSVSNTTIGAGGLTFRSISAAGGSNGILLNNTGSTAGLTVTGDGVTAGSGGTLQNINGSGVEVTNVKGLSLSWMNLTNADLVDGGAAGGTCDLANVSTCKGAIDLTGVTGVSLTRVVINGSEEQGIVGSNVTDFSMTNCTVQNAGNAAAENGVYFLGLYGTVNITGSMFTGNAFENFGVLNTTGSTPLVMTVTGSTFSSNSSIGGDGLLLDVRDGTNTTVTVKGSTFTANKDDHFQVAPSGSAVVNATFGGPTLADRNTLTGGHASPTGQGIAMRVGGPFTGTFTFDINNNSINGAIPTAINTGAGSMSGGVINGKIRNNVIGTAGSALSCSAQGSGILAETNGQGSGGTYNALITGNTLRQCFDKGIDLLGSRDTGNSALNVTATGNNVDELQNAASRWAIRLETGSSLATETGTVCADISGNTLHALTQVDEISIRQRSNTPVRLAGYTGGANNDAAVVTYLQGRNAAGGTATVTHTLATNFLNTNPAGSACPTPP